MSVVKRNKEPLLMISFEINKPTRPVMTIYEDSDVHQLIQEFVSTHKLKQTATTIIRNVIDKNMKEIREEEQRIRDMDGVKPKVTTRRASKTSIQESNKENIRQPILSSKSSQSSQSSKQLHEPLELRPSVLCKVLEQAKNTEECEQVGMNELQKEFDRQFQTIRTNRMLRNCQSQLDDLYKRLTRLNPPGLTTIEPDYIDFSCFEPKLLDCLEKFFARLQEEEFIDLDYDAFKYLLEKYHCIELVKELTEEH